MRNESSQTLIKNPILETKIPDKNDCYNTFRYLKSIWFGSAQYLIQVAREERLQLRTSQYNKMVICLDSNRNTRIPIIY